MSEPARGDIWFAELDHAPPAVGHEQAGRRPVLVISDDRYNAGRAGLVIIVPLTRRIRPNPLHLVIQPPQGGVRSESAILCDQVRSVSKQRLIERWGAIEASTLRQVDVRVRTVLGQQ
jgi:mRNA interferase MazF